MTLDHPPLTHDERKAAEAAFQGRPFNPLCRTKPSASMTASAPCKPTALPTAGLRMLCLQFEPPSPVRRLICITPIRLPSFLGLHKFGCSNIRTRRSAAWKCVQVLRRSSNS